MKKVNYQRIYQFKITLPGFKPSIWRRIQVPGNYTFWELHVALQDAMGWDNCHLFEFSIKSPGDGIETQIGIPDDTGFSDEILDARKLKIENFFTLENKLAGYLYDFGDNWGHNVHLEKILLREKGVIYPRCLAGKRACPPEDCGGGWGYEKLLEIIKNPRRKDYKEMMEWLGGPFDPEAFDPVEVVFTNPKERLADLNL